MEAAKESFAQRHSVLISSYTSRTSLTSFPSLHEVCTALHFLEHSLSQS